MSSKPIRFWIGFKIMDRIIVPITNPPAIFNMDLKFIIYGISFVGCFICLFKMFLVGNIQKMPEHTKKVVRANEYKSEQG